MMKCDAWHTVCACRKILGALLWLAGFVSLVFAWVAVNKDTFLGYDPIFWMFNAMIFGILAIPLKLHKRYSMKMDMDMMCCEKDMKGCVDGICKGGVCCGKGEGEGEK